jgi:hypothetical protein
MDCRRGVRVSPPPPRGPPPPRRWQAERLLDAGQAPLRHHGAQPLEAGEMEADFGEDVHDVALCRDVRCRALYSSECPRQLISPPQLGRVGWGKRAKTVRPKRGFPSYPPRIGGELAGLRNTLLAIPSQDILWSFEGSDHGETAPEVAGGLGSAGG